jgi:hypothetical protein
MTAAESQRLPRPDSNGAAIIPAEQLDERRQARAARAASAALHGTYTGSAEAIPKMIGITTGGGAGNQQEFERLEREDRLPNGPDPHAPSYQGWRIGLQPHEEALRKQETPLTPAQIADLLPRIGLRGEWTHRATAGDDAPLHVFERALSDADPVLKPINYRSRLTKTLRSSLSLSGDPAVGYETLTVETPEVVMPEDMLLVISLEDQLATAVSEQTSFLQFEKPVYAHPPAMLPSYLRP